ncbi:hypothetical protein [Sphingomonas sp. SRS2]|nr:hypothetical protein [Sphingomonas sp. SRS2]
MDQAADRGDRVDSGGVAAVERRAQLLDIAPIVARDVGVEGDHRQGVDFL